MVSGLFPGAQDYREGNLEFKFVGNYRNYVVSVFSYAYKAQKFLREKAKDYDIVVEDFAPWNPVFSYRYKSVEKVVLQLHHKEEKEILKRYTIAGYPFYLIERYYPKKFKNIIFASQSCKNAFGLEGIIIGNGINDDLLKYEINMGEYILYVGRLDIYNKGLDILIDAVENYPLVIAGKGKDEEEVLNRIKSRKNIKFVGYVNEENKIEYILNSKFLIMPSRFEGQGIVALEAAALGKPVIVSDIQGLKYVVENGFGLSFHKDNVKDLSDKIKYLWNNPDLINEMGRRGKTFARNFVWDNIANKYEEYLLSILNT